METLVETLCFLYGQSVDIVAKFGIVLMQSQLTFIEIEVAAKS